ncbi:prion-like-(Q/N-rich) domain-bearing protein 25 [Periplaneta americana]|uniref:prion-like-(Q/N-rich) domain-bearing protein 25 n=1 Tax=Periplaneta americana TaxID=6978 RepID=UPI0037E980BD
MRAAILLWYVRYLLLFFSFQVSAMSVENPSCKTKQDCDDLWAAPYISKCEDGLCNCTGGSKFIEEKQTCKCPQGFGVGSTGCVPELKKLRSSCKTQDECVRDLGELATCVSEECICVSGAVPVNGVCKKKKYLFSSCEYDEECSHMKNAVCKQKNCTCEENHLATPDHKACIPMLTNMWSSCQYDIQCTESFGEGSYCRSRCLCKSGYHEIKNSRCVQDRTAGERCSEDSECYVDTDVNIIKMSCINDRCVDPNAGTKTNVATKMHFPLVIVVLTSIVTSAYVPDTTYL